MSKELNELFEEMNKLNQSIKMILRNSTYDEYDDLSGLDIDFENAEELLLLDEAQGIVEKLADVHSQLNYLARPIKYTGRLFKNHEGRYQTKQGDYWTSGKIIEVLVFDEGLETYRWTKTRMEHDGDDYYLVYFKGIPMDGLQVRVRK